MKFCSLLLATLAATLLAGCASRMVNLTARSVEPASADVYRFEFQWDSSRRGANNPEVKVYVMIDETLYPLERIRGTTDRWEGNVPIPAGKPVITYRYKVDYTYPKISSRVAQSELSLPYFLEVQRPAPAGTVPAQ